MTIIGRLLEKWFGLESRPKCENCEYFRHLFEQELMRSERMVEMLAKLGARESSPPAQILSKEAYQPVPSKYTPWSVLRAKLETADRAKFLEEQKKAEAKINVPQPDPMAAARIDALEKELEIGEEDSDASDQRKAV